MKREGWQTIRKQCNRPHHNNKAREDSRASIVHAGFSHNASCWRDRCVDAETRRATRGEGLHHRIAARVSLVFPSGVRPRVGTGEYLKLDQRAECRT